MGRNRSQGPRRAARCRTSTAWPGRAHLRPAPATPFHSKLPRNPFRRCPMLLMLDNYDSFTYNLVQYFGELGEDVRVARNDQITLDEIAAMRPDRICVSPGP